MKKKILVGLLSALLLLALLTVTATATDGNTADNNKSIQLNTSNLEGARVSSIYFGNYPQNSDGSYSPIKWQVLKNDNGKLLLLSDKILDDKQYNTEDVDVTWETCTIRSWLNGYGPDQNDQEIDYSTDNFINKAFSESERSMIEVTHITTADNPYEGSTTSGGNDTDDKVFLLSLEEATSAEYNLDEDADRMALVTPYVNSQISGSDRDYYTWFLRTPGWGQNYCVVVIGSDGSYENYLVGLYVYHEWGIRPALTLNTTTDEILFISTPNGKNASDMDSRLTAVPDNSENEWKMTMLDENRDSFTVETTAVNGNTLTIAYSGGQLFEGNYFSNNEYISAMIIDENGTIKYYGRLSQSKQFGEVTLTLPGDFDQANDTLYLFNEQYNGGTNIDYSSPLREVSLTAGPQPSKDSMQFGASQLEGGQRDKVYFGQYKQSMDTYGNYNTDPISWLVLANENNQLLIRSEKTMDAKKYNSDFPYDEVTWQNSFIRSWLNGYDSTENYDQTDCTSDNFINNAFSLIEKGAIAHTSGVDAEIFLLSVEDTNNRNYFPNGKFDLFVENTDYVRKLTQNTPVAWLRDMSFNIAYTAKDYAYALCNGAGHYSYLNTYYVERTNIAVIPALNLDLNDVLFSSAMDNGYGKSTAGAESNLTQMPAYLGNEWKLTLKDSNRNLTATIQSSDSDTIRFTYDNATAGDNEYISAIITDENGAITYYGRLKKISDKYDVSGELTISLPQDFDISYDKFYVFSEQYNEGCLTDYASEPIDLLAQVGLAKYLQPAENILQKHVNEADGYTIYFNHSNYPTAWIVIGYDGQGVAASADAVTLLMQETITGPIAFMYVDVSNSYNISRVHSLLSNYGSDQPAVREVIQPRTLTASDYSEASTDGIAGSQIDNALFWALSTKEAYALDPALRTLKSSSPDEDTSWWLRSPGSNEVLAAYVKGDGEILYYGDYVGEQHTARAAVNLQLDSLLFALAVDAESPQGSLAAIGSVFSNEWRLALLYSAQTATFATTAYNEDTRQLTVQYELSDSGSDTFISGLIADSSGEYTHYGRLKAITTDSDKSGTLTIELPADFNSKTDTLYLFSEKDGGYALNILVSEPQRIILESTLSATPQGLTFATVSEGYEEAPAAQTVTITNNGNQIVIVDLPTASKYNITAGDGFSGNQAELAPAASATFTVQPKLELRVGTHNETLTISGSNDSTATVELKFTVDGQPVYSFSATPNTLSFDSVTEGYEDAPAAQTVTITNNGNQTVTVDLPSIDNYDITAGDGFNEGRAELAPNDEATFTVQPQTALNVGNYDTTLTISGSDNTSATVELKFTVDDDIEQPVYQISATPQELTFTTVTEGYEDAPAAQTVTITNNGNQIVTVDLPTASNYLITAGDGFNEGRAELAPNDEATFTVQPQTALNVGNYDTTLTISGSNDVSATVELIFSVTAQQTYLLSVDLAGGNGDTIGGNYAAGEIINIDAGTKANCRFVGWVTSDGGRFGDASSASTTFTMPANATTITATWQYINQGSTTRYYMLKFDTNGGSEIAAIRKASGSRIDLGAYTPTREGYRFSGWYADEELTEAITTIRLTANQTVYAGWEVENPFSDVAKTDWFYNDIMFVYGEKLMLGTSDTLFSPDKIITRAEAITIIWRLEGEPVVDYAINFSDVENDEWYSEAIRWAASEEIMKGYGDGSFGVKDPLTKEQLSAILWRYSQYKGYDISAGEDVDLSIFTDAAQISDYAYTAVQWAYDAGIIKGNGDGTLNPAGNSKRCEFAAMITRYVQNIAQ